jgi:hypothetical protein
VIDFFNNQEDTTMPEKSKTEKPNKPVHEIRDGAIQVSVWKNESEKGPWYSVTCRRRYKDKAADEWKDSYSYGQDDLLTLAKLLDMAHSWILNQQQQQRTQKAA